VGLKPIPFRYAEIVLDEFKGADRNSSFFHFVVESELYHIKSLIDPDQVLYAEGQREYNDKNVSVHTCTILFFDG